MHLDGSISLLQTNPLTIKHGSAIQVRPTYSMFVSQESQMENENYESYPYYYYFFLGLIFAFGVSDCKHRKNAEDFFKPIAYLKVCKFCKLSM